MNRLHRLLIVIVPSLFVGAIVASATLGEAQPRPRAAPAPAAAPSPQPRPTPHRGQVTVTVEGDLSEEIGARVQAEITRAIAELEANPDIPPKIRARVLKSLAKVQRSKLRDLSQLGAALRDLQSELEGLGDEVADEMPDIEREVARALRSSGIARQRAEAADGDDEADWDEPDDAEPPDDEDPATLDGAPAGPATGRWRRLVPTPPTPPTPPASSTRPTPPLPPAGPDLLMGGFAPLDAIDIAIDLDDVRVTASQTRDLRRIASDERATSEAARDRIRSMSVELRRAIEKVDVDEAEVGRLVDRITSEEATVRKARLLALTRARKVLTAQQRAKVER